MSKKYTIEEARKKFAENGLILLEEEYIGNKVKMRAKCPKHPDEVLWLRLNDVCSGHGCKYCGIEKRVDERRNNFDIVEKAFYNKGYKLLSTQKDYINSSTKLAYFCPNHPDEVQYISYNSIRQGHGCNKCASEENGRKQRKDFNFIQKYFEEVGYQLLSGPEDYVNSSSMLKYICPKHKEYVQQVNWTNFYGRESRCRYCASQNSKGEDKIAAWLKNNDVLFIRQKRFNNLRNPKTNYQLSYDFWLPNYNILIEYQGGYHNGMVNKRNPKKQTADDLKEQQYRDELKRQYAKDHGFKLLEIWYWDYENIEEILKKEMIW